MKIKCYNCGQKNEKDVYKCEKCWEVFRQSEEKYKEFLKNKETELQQYQSNETEPEIIDQKKGTEKQQPKKLEIESYKQARIICWIPFLLFARYAWKNINLESKNWTATLILTLFEWLILTLILLFFKRKIIRYGKKNGKTKNFINSVMFALLMIMFLIPYIIYIIYLLLH